jgi:hypothetical protein
MEGSYRRNLHHHDHREEGRAFRYYKKTTLKILVSKVRATKLVEKIKFPRGLVAQYTNGDDRDSLNLCAPGLVLY